MTIPSRSAPPVPITTTRPNHQQQSAIMSAWSQSGDNHPPSHQQQHSSSAVRKKPPPPRPPLPQALANISSSNNGADSHRPNQPKNIASLTNIFRRMKTNDNPSRDLFSLPPPPKASSHHNTHRSFANTGATSHQQEQQHNQPREPLGTNSNTVELISFDSPPNSPTPTQKSVSSWNSSLSFSGSDLATTASSSSQMVSNWTPTHSNSNGGACSVSTTHSESGFEDDFTSQAMFDPFSPEIGVMPVYGTAPSATSTAYGASNAPNKSASTFWSADFLDPLCNGKSLLPPEPLVTKPTIIRPVMKSTTTAAASKAAGQSSASTSVFSGPSSSSRMQQKDVKRVNKPKESYAVVLYQFDALQEGDLNLMPSENVYLLRQINDDWFYGRNERGQEGMLPSAYVDVKIPLPAVRDEPIAQPAAATAIDKSPMPQAAGAARPARALFTFMAQTADDLTIFEGEPVGVLHVINDDWWYGETVSGRGQFPAAYVELL